MDSSEHQVLKELFSSDIMNVVYDVNKYPIWISAALANQVAYTPYISSSETAALASCLKAINDSKLLEGVRLQLTTIEVHNRDWR